MDVAGTRPSVVVFDLGGVLVTLGGVSAMAELSGGLTEEELWARWLSCRWVRAFERGRCDAAAFAAGVIADWGLAIESDAFLTAFAAWPIGLEEGAAELVSAVRATTATACLSNTNALHWQEQRTRGFGLETMFDHAFLSHELDLVKPDPEVYVHVAGALGRAPHELLFLDDNALNVDAACDAGWVADRVRGVGEARAALVRHGILPPG